MKKEIVAKFKELYKQEPAVVRIPGNTNQEQDQASCDKGFGMPVATDKGIYFAIAPNGLHLCRVHAFDEKQSDAFFLKQRMSRSSRSWENSIKGVVAQFLKAGYEVEGFDLVFGSNGLIETGLSSATIEQGFACALNHIFDFNIVKFELLKMTQKDEPEYA